MKKFINSRKKALLSGVVAIVVLATAGITIAFLIDKTGDVTNTFTPTEVTCEVYEPDWDDKEDTVKENVSIKNTGDIDAYIRATLVFNWVDAEGNISSQSVKDSDYTFTLAENTKWIEGNDGYWYWPEIVPNVDDETTDEVIENATGILIGSIVPNYEAAPNGCTLSVEVIADAIQADGVSSSDETGGAGKAPAEIAWSNDKVTVTVDGDTLSIINKYN